MFLLSNFRVYVELQFILKSQSLASTGSLSARATLAGTAVTALRLPVPHRLLVPHGQAQAVLRTGIQFLSLAPSPRAGPRAYY